MWQIICLLLSGPVLAVTSQGLFTDLFASYHVSERPYPAPGQPVVIKMGMAIRNIVTVDSKRHLFVTNVWIRQYWQDPRLAWNPDDYNGTRLIQIDHNLHWKPDIFLYDNAAAEVKHAYEDLYTPVSSDGNIVFMYPAVLTTHCSYDVHHYPFDEQHCTIKYGSWAYDGGDLDLRMKDENPADVSNYRPMHGWTLVKMTAQRNSASYGCCPYPFYDVTFTVTIRRNWVIPFLNIFLPLTITNVLVVAQFLLPVDSTEKISLCITLFLTQVVYLLLLDETLPVSSSVPVIMHYMVGTLLLVGCSMISNVFTLHIHFNGRHDNDMQLPAWGRKYFLHGLARLFCMHRFITSDEEHEEKLHPVISKTELDDEEKTMCATTIHVLPEDPTCDNNNNISVTGSKVSPLQRNRLLENQGSPLSLHRPSLTPTAGSIRPSIHSMSRNTISESREARRRSHVHLMTHSNHVVMTPQDLKEHSEILLFKLVKCAEDLKEHLHIQDVKEELQSEWQQLAMMIDRLFFIIYLIFILGLHLYIYINHPKYDASVVG